MNILVTICARVGSKGVKNKNIRNLCNHPLELYTLEAYRSFCEKAAGIEGGVQLALNTDSKELIEQMEAPGADYIWIRREEERLLNLIL